MIHSFMLLRESYTISVCREPFRVGSSSKCPDRVGTHEPNHTLKDNDLTTKIRMKPEEAYEIIDAVHKDSDALCQVFS